MCIRDRLRLDRVDILRRDRNDLAGLVERILNRRYAEQDGCVFQDAAAEQRHVFRHVLEALRMADLRAVLLAQADRCV